MKTAYLLQHLNIHPNGDECLKTIGIYETKEDAEAAVGRLADKPGFSEHPEIVDFDTAEDERGFHLDEYEIGQDNWAEGFFTDHHD